MKLKLGVLAAMLCGQMAAAQEAYVAKLELNTVAQAGDACRLVFTASADVGLDQLIVETVLFDGAGQVKLLTLFDFGALPASKLRVRQFDIPQSQCTDVARILFNGVDQCSGASCDGALAVTSRVDGVEVLG